MMATDGGGHKLVVKQRATGLQEVSDLNLMALPLHFTLALPFGTAGWHPDLRTEDAKRLTPMKYFAFLLSVRNRDVDYLFQMGRLFQEFVIFGRMIIDNSRLMYQLTHQKELRAETYCSLREEVERRLREGTGNHGAVGKKIVLSPSFEGGKRKWNLRYQNGMAIVRHFRKPDIFLTYTFPPNTPELVAELLPGQSPQVSMTESIFFANSTQDRPDLVARAFEVKKNLLLNEIIKGGVFGRIVGYISVVEYQAKLWPNVF